MFKADGPLLCPFLAALREACLRRFSASLFAVDALQTSLAQRVWMVIMAQCRLPSGNVKSAGAVVNSTWRVHLCIVTILLELVLLRHLAFDLFTVLKYV